ncbi:PP2C family serine/threonine-protein phosphatase [Neobacillus sp. NPDC097160]|uniref:PP2C family serine/threonine-protein phosphatase n=1 Tax=Neobacillus sp. NPDC097160 TaxID=3364298 RepID=UPI0038077FA4
MVPNENQEPFRKLRWIGKEAPYLGQIKIDSCEELVLGRYGGHRQAGAYKNEDGALAVKGADWEFAMILDGHNSAESVNLVLKTIENKFDKLAIILEEQIDTVFQSFESHILSIFQSEAFLESCKQIQGETACLLCVRKEKYLWWLSVGDCVIYLLHEDLHKLGQYALNQRQFYEWIGQINTFSLPIPCYSSGIRELRTGQNRIILVTDGVLECAERFYETSLHLYNDCYEGDVPANVKHILQHVHESAGQDSATIICWDYVNPHPAAIPSNQPKR